ncbi:mating-type protein MAT alpha 1 HMG-box domain-containing protein [Sarocladium implicatum]|nr:mating-type protein MAT alpha 1 HMG-box domain-containing protein [Sarocladium implicatum]
MAQPRYELMQRLADLSAEEIASLLQDENILDAAADYFARTDFPPQNATVPASQESMISPASPASSAVAPANTPSGGLPKRTRPVNAFVAFRSYYVKIFPGVPQKARSGCLTKLWAAERFRNRWALLAKVYSFVRDEMVGKTKLAYFLHLSCPLMGILAPNEYLGTLGWAMSRDEDGNPDVVLLDQHAVHRFMNGNPSTVPSTEIELLSGLVQVGYLPQDGFDLLNRMAGISNGMMTATHNTHNSAKLDFIATVRSNPDQAAQDLVGTCPMDSFAVKFHHVEDLNSISPLTTRDGEPSRQPYPYASNHSLLYQSDQAHMDLDAVGDHEALDIDSPWDLDTVLDQAEPEGVRSTSDAPTMRHDPHQDFHFGF